MHESCSNLKSDFGCRSNTGKKMNDPHCTSMKVFPINWNLWFEPVLAYSWGILNIKLEDPINCLWNLKSINIIIFVSDWSVVRTQRVNGIDTTATIQRSFRRPKPAQTVTVDRPELQIRSNEFRPWENCKSPKSYVFLKKHEVAFSTLRIIFKKIDKHLGLKSEPTLVGPQGGCYSARITKKCLVGGYKKI